jgi:phosphoribosylanthranilate isomerase
MTIRVKICGLTNATDALHAAECGADFLGFIMAPISKRYITPQTAYTLIDSVRQKLGDHAPICVGVFVAEDEFTPDLISEHARISTIDLAQITSMPDKSFLQSIEIPAYASIRPETPAQAADQSAHFDRPDLDSSLPSIMLDTYHPTRHGGTGQTAPEAVARTIVAQTQRLILAGGLNPDNVAHHITTIQPWAVDVASGTEASPGQKNPHKVHAFITAAKGAK